MEILKQITLVSVLSILSFTIVSQETEPMAKAFIKSFELENTGKYSEAADIIISSYNKESYECNMRLGWLYYKANNYDNSAKYYYIAGKLMPYSVEAKLALTLPLSEQNKWDDIMQVYKDVLAIDSKNYKALYNLGLIYYNRSLFYAAFDNFKILNNLYPTDYSASLMYAWSNVMLGKNREAKVLFNKILLLYPSDKSATEGLSILE